MKLFALLFPFYIMFLAIEPGLKAMVSMNSQTTTCCNDAVCDPFEEKVTESQPESDETSDNCNPFQFCKCCSFVNREVNVVTDLVPLFFSRAHVRYNDNMIPEISLEFWQPPKIA